MDTCWINSVLGSKEDVGRLYRELTDEYELECNWPLGCIDLDVLEDNHCQYFSHYKNLGHHVDFYAHGQPVRGASDQLFSSLNEDRE